MNILKIKREDHLFPRFCEMPGFEIPDHAISTTIEHDFFHVGLLVESNENILGRCAIYLNPNHNKEGKKSLTIGYFEAYNDITIVQLLFDQVKKIAFESHCDFIIGPINSSTWNEYRFITKGREQNFASEYTIPNFYPKLWKQYGFVTTDTYRSDRIDISNAGPIPQKMEYDLGNQKVFLSDLTDRDLAFELKRIGELSLQSFSQNYFYTPIGLEKFVAKYDLNLLDQIRKYIIIAESESGKLLGYLFSFPNHLDSESRGLVVKTFARHADSDYKGIGKILCKTIYAKAVNNQFDYVINAYYHEQNISGKLSTGFNGNHLRTYELLEYNLAT